MLAYSTYKKTIKKSVDLDFKKMKRDLLSIYNGRIKRWFDAMDLYDRGITTHTLRVTAISLELGRALGLNSEELLSIQYGTLLHDIGKLGIPDSIICKPGKLTPQEYEIVQKHPIYADEWLTNWDKDEPARAIPLHHHERWDGCGYPYRLRGEAIPLLARVVAVADVWDAITSIRPYRGAMSNAQAIRVMRAESGKQFDPDILKVFLNLGVQETRTVPFSSALIL